MDRYRLPEEIKHLIHARNQLRARFDCYGLKFTLDGNLVGDLGEAIAAELFDLTLVERRGQKSVDAYTKGHNPKTVQIKATGRGDAFVFTHSDAPADYLIGLVLRYEEEEVEIAYNGPYNIDAFGLHPQWLGQRQKRVSMFRRLNAEVRDDERLIANAERKATGTTPSNV